MKIYLAIKYHPDNTNREFITELANKLENAGIDSIIAVKDLEQWGKIHFTPQKLMDLSFKQIDLCDALVLEFSEKGVGLGIEAGYCYARKIPIYVIAKQGSDISNTIQGIATEIYLYDQLSELDEYFEKINLSFQRQIEAS
ncbi:hypothetical protein NEF87_003673 [Candidatus Lokiarchaeum ossiferum]|uniref:Nucleoside 2-deoxyribosyltransferase n=1 Tax=Candidatus Lokiarchaeum ossiferum TaxID=2951803 RepID=A0ABY6HVM9_9ARCH|nr:hypothetical protein NEF87_003673 [Candidatus Lokiarchaeum sp. B-35]